MSLPLVEELVPPPQPYEALGAVVDCENVLLLESARRDERLGRYTFLAADPYAFFTLQKPEYGVDPFAEIKPLLAQQTAERLPALPPFQGGAAGLLGYELGGCWERLPLAGIDEFDLPVMAIGLYDSVLAWDHQQNRAWIISQGFPETDPDRRRSRAEKRLREFKRRLTNSPAVSQQKVTQKPATPNATWAKQNSLDAHRPWVSNFSAEEYLAAVGRTIEHIRAGDIFQANLSQRLLRQLDRSPYQLYGDLRRENPAPFAAYFSHDDWSLASASPERFVQLEDRIASSRPIKGTRRRKPQPEADLYTRDELRESEKDQAENVMIVDLLRNDLSSVCQAGTIRVPELCRVESYQTVQHLVSEIRGVLAEGKDAWDLMAALFPGGSITGAPKVRAMEIIAELEPTVRGPYCGSLFYLGYDGSFDSSILIRTFTMRHGWIQCPVGGGVVAQSSPQAEYEETWHKAAGMLAAVASRQ